MVRPVVIAMVMMAGIAAPASAQTFTQFYGFGDSSIDSGYYRALPNPGGGALFNALWASAVANGAGAPTSRPGLMNSELLASYFGLTAIPSNQPGGTNFATSGAKNVVVNNRINGGFTAAVPTVTQINNYLAASGGRANPSALYLISTGGNDVTFATGGSGSGPFPVSSTAYLTGVANGLATAVATLQAAGARYIIVPDQPYSFPLGGGAGNAASRQAKLDYSLAQWSALTSAGVRFIPADFNAVRLAIAANPSAFGFEFIDTASGHTACTQPAGVTTAWALLCSSNPASPSHFATPTADQTRLFADDQHLSTAGQKIQADYYYNLVVAPSQISFLAEAPIKTRTAMVDAISNQILLSFGEPGTFHGWITGDVSSLKMNNSYVGFPDDPGTPVAVTAGFDYRLSREWLIGAAFSGGTTKQSFSLGGDYTQDEFAVSLYASYRNDPFWFDAIASWGTLHNDINRLIPIGITVQPNQGRTNGTDISFAAETGYNFTTALGGVAPVVGMPVKAVPPAALYLTHGPVVGIVLQQVHIDGFTEFNPAGITALSFGSQRRDSAVTEFGYQASLTFGMWQPYVKAVWNHELVDNDRTVTALLTSIAAPSYSLPAVDLGHDWGTGTLGLRVKLNASASAYAAFIAQVGQDSAAIYGGQVGLNVAFNWAPAPVVAKY